MRPGKRRYRITLQSPVTTTNRYNERDTGWTDEDTVWASKRTESGQENEYAQQTESYRATVWNIRSHDSVTSSWRVKHDGKTYPIQAVLPMEHAETEQELVTAMED